ncbi:MAG: capsule assembly Wzi family protein [Candidatus Acidiferrales bacterium]
MSPTGPALPFVELDSWVYPVFDRLAALGYIHAEFLGIRPWTRGECAELVSEAGNNITDDSPPDVRQMYAVLLAEFEPEFAASRKPSANIESVYADVTGIKGSPLNDSYHFGQTIVNNFGRPYEGGFNSYDGFSAYASAGRFVIYTREEFQHAPSASPYPLAVRQFIATIDENPLEPSTPTAAANQFRLLDTYVGVNLAGWELSFGKQSLWWGPDQGGALMFSDNAEPIYMFRASRVIPFELPWIFRLLGPVKLDAFFGKLSGNDFPPRPLIHGEKISFKPTPNLELGFSRTAEFSGVGRPLTFLSLFRSYTMFTSGYGEPPDQNPGKRMGGFDASYALPYLRNRLTIYGDALSDDDPSPIANPPRAALSAGFYMPRLPGLRKFDLRGEAVYTDAPNGENGGHYVYFDGFYRDLYTNKGNLIGSWIGREGTGFQGWMTYWASPKNSVQFGYRHATISKDFVPKGESITDGSVKVNWWLRNDLSISGSLQYERWLAPILAASSQSDWTSGVNITFWPKNIHR